MPSLTKAQKRRLCSLLFECMITAFSLLAVILACATAKQAGYSAWYKRLLYFTQQSNIWIGLTAGASVLFSLHPRLRTRELPRKLLNLLRYIFTVSITLTGVIFCALLAPFAEENIWSLAGVLTHVVVPLLSIADLFIRTDGAPLQRCAIPLSLLPPALYYAMSLLIGALGIDFGLGVLYPYFFMDTASGVPFFGAAFDGELPQLGMGWWLIILFLFVSGVATLYYRLHPCRNRSKPSHS